MLHLNIIDNVLEALISLLTPVSSPEAVFEAGAYRRSDIVCLCSI